MTSLLRMVLPKVFVVLSMLLGLSCQGPQEEVQAKLELPERPNILWLVCEDRGPWIPAFGDSTIQTPNLSRLAREGVRDTHVYSPSGVCSPSRAAIATGMYPSGIGANHMRTTSDTEKTGLPPYEAVPPVGTRMMSEWLRSEGYYCTNNMKEDYQFQAPLTAWDESGYYAHWRNRKQGQPFFSVFNFDVTHESVLFEPYGIPELNLRDNHAGDTSIARTPWAYVNPEHETPIHLAKDADVPIPPYLPDNEVFRHDV